MAVGIEQARDHGHAMQIDDGVDWNVRLVLPASPGMATILPFWITRLT